jgi:hypothetical protein
MNAITRICLTFTLFVLVFALALLTLPRSDAGAAPQWARTTANVIFAYGPETTALTGTQTITPGRSLLLAAPSDVLTITLATGGALPGDHLLVINTVATSTYIAATGTTLGSAAHLQERDAVRFTYADGVWVDEGIENN